MVHNHVVKQLIIFSFAWFLQSSDFFQGILVRIHLHFHNSQLISNNTSFVSVASLGVSGFGLSVLKIVASGGLGFALSSLLS